MRLIIFLLLILIVSCKPTPEKVERMFPSDYLFSQRSFPSGKIDMKAYRAALQSRTDYQSSNKNFDEPWTSEGPTNLGGRVVDIEMPYDDRNTIYVGSASGGIFKSSDLGNNWTSIFDHNESLSIGDMAIDKNNSDLIYVGTGESNAGGGSLAYDGNGVYLSDDAGNSWTSIGLENVGSIGRVVIDPQDSEKVFVAAMGTLFANNSERGIYRTEDGGDTWEQVLFLSDSTGGIDLAIHPSDGNIVYAAMWERIRRPHDRAYGGATSGIYKTEDGGDTWNELTIGLPSIPQNKGRIGMAISESDPNILYAYYAQTDGPISGIFRSEDGGETWVSKSIAGVSNVPFIWWFGKIFVNPTDPDDVYVTSLRMHRSRDGGNSWTEVFANAHVDHHALFVHPSDTTIVLNGNDGGIYRNLIALDTLPGDTIIGDYLTGYSNFQFYTCEVNPHNPSILLGGAQDNGTLINDGSADSWRQIYGGDGFRVIVDPEDENRIYAEFHRGNIAYSTDGGNSFMPATTGITGVANWNTPIAMDPADSRILYTGRQELFKSTDGAESWLAVSDSLVNPDNPVGVNTYGTLTTIDVSSYDSQVIYIGTDDGNVWVTQDGGSNYDNISSSLPERWITAVAHDPLLSSGVYVTVSGFRFGESSAQVFYSSDYGRSWESIGSNLPDVPVNDIVPDDQLAGTVYIATDIGVFRGENRGDWWNLLGTDMPMVPVIDLDYDSASRTMAAATFGKGIYTYILPSEPSVTSSPEDNFLRVYPNPASDRISVSGVSDQEVYVITDNLGKVVRRVLSTQAVSVEDLEPGIYYVVTEAGRSVKFVKQ